MITQRSLIKEYTDNFIKDFNPRLFVRSDDMIIEELKKVILSCQRQSEHFTLKVHSFTVIDDYDQIITVLYNFDEEYNKNKRRSSSKKNLNPYEYLQLKNTAMRLLIVKYYIQVNNQYEYVDVIIAVPRVVDKYYFKINGKLCCMMYQISDITYNNASSANAGKAKSTRVTLRTIFMPIKVFKKKFNLVTYNKEEVPTSFFISKIFSKMFGVIKYTLAKFGLNEAIKFYGYEQMLFINNILIEDDNYYIFHKYGIYIYANKEIFNLDEVLQSLVYNIYISIDKNTEYASFFTQNYWLKSLGKEFNIDSEEKGIQLLQSLESLYDIKTHEILRLPECEKATIYHVLRWFIREFNALMNKSNMNLGYKRIRCEEIAAALYAYKISTGLYRVINSNKRSKKKKKSRLTIDSVKKAICTLPMYLITAISKCNLVNYRELVHDLDSLVMLDASFNGPSGLSDDSMSNISNEMRYVDPSHIGRLDLDSSKKSSPGINISLTPTCYVNEDGYFSDFEEPMTWDDRVNKVMTDIKKAQGLKDVINFQQEVLGEEYFDEDPIDPFIDIMKNLIQPIYFVEKGGKDTTYSEVVGDFGIIKEEEEDDFI